MDVIVGKTYENETILIDDQRFEDCTFSHCILKYGASGPGTLIRCTVTNSIYTFVDAAERTLQRLAAMYQNGETTLVEELFNQIRSPRPDPILKES